MGQAHGLAGDRIVEVAAGDVGGQLLAAGLIEEVRMDVVPVVFGTGTPVWLPTGHIFSVALECERNRSAFRACGLPRSISHQGVRRLDRGPRNQARHAT